MVRKAIILTLILLFPLLCEAQMRVKKAMKLIEKQRYNSAFVLLKKELAKDSANVAAEYALAHYHSTPQNADFQLDSAYRHITRAIRHWQALPDRSKKNLKRFPVDSLVLINTREDIETEAFDQAKALNTEEAFARFIASFPQARQRSLARQLQEKVAFEKAGTQNTHMAFLDYITRYPESPFREQAQQKYDRLLFEFSTGEKTIEAYAAYLKANPQSPYRREVEKNIFEIATADGSAEAFRLYLDTYPQSYFADQASSILHHLLVEEWSGDSVSTRPIHSADTAMMSKSFLLPFLHNGKFGLMDNHGSVVVPAQFEDIGKEYLCGNLQEDILVMDGNIYSSNGKLLYEGNVTSLDELGHGFLLVEDDDKLHVLHKSGFTLPEAGFEDAKLLNGRMFALKKNGLWGLFSLAGRKLLNYDCQDIFAIGNVYVLKVNDRFTLSTISSLAEIANGKKGRFTEAFDEVKKIFDDNLWIRLGKFEGVLNPELQILVKVDSHRVSPTWFGALATSAKGSSLFNRFGEESPLFDKVQMIKPWVAVKTRNAWELFDPALRISKSVPYDSIAIHGPYAIGFTKDGIEMHIHKKSDPIILPKPEQIELLPAQDSLAYLLLKHDKKMHIYDQDGSKKFTTSYDKIQAAGKGIFIAARKEKKGLLNDTGKIILPFEYDAIGNVSNGNISLLKAMKFGLYNLPRKKLIKPEYEKNINAYNENVYTVFKNGSVGFVDVNNKIVGKLAYTEIMPWTDSVAIVRSNGTWSLFNVYTKQNDLEDISSFKIIRNNPGDRLMIVKQHNQVGVYSSRDGIVIPVNFSDIVNVGSPEVPVYFTEKHVPEASLFVVIYYDHKGKLLRREVYEQDDYEKIYCNQ